MHGRLFATLKSSFKNCFNPSERHAGSFTLEIQRAADAERSMMLMQRAITGGIISERDRLLQYTTGEFYTELSLFLQEVETKNKETEKMFKK